MLIIAFIIAPIYLHFLNINTKAKFKSDQLKELERNINACILINSVYMVLIQVHRVVWWLWGS